jgi:hypothetical protein
MVDGWMDGWVVDGWVDEWMGGRVHGWADEWMGGGWVDGCKRTAPNTECKVGLTVNEHISTLEFNGDVWAHVHRILSSVCVIEPIFLPPALYPKHGASIGNRTVIDCNHTHLENPQCRQRKTMEHKW